MFERIYNLFFRRKTDKLEANEHYTDNFGRLIKIKEVYYDHAISVDRKYYYYKRRYNVWYEGYNRNIFLCRLTKRDIKKHWPQIIGENK